MSLSTRTSTLDQHNFYKVLDHQIGDALVFIGTEGCGACRAMRRALSQLPAELDLDLYEVDAAQALGVIEDLEVFHLPALFLWRGGEHHRPIECEARPDALEAAIRLAKAAPGLAAP